VVGEGQTVNLPIDVNTTYDQRTLRRLINKHRKIIQRLEAALAEMCRVTEGPRKREHLWESIAAYLSESGPQPLSLIQREMIRREIIKDRRNPAAQVKKSLERCKKFSQLDDGRYICEN
jgi:hypothetical protein